MPFKMNCRFVAILLYLPHFQRHLLSSFGQGFCTTLHNGITWVDDHRVAVCKQFHLLATFYFVAHEVLLMGGSQIGHHANGRLDDTFQPFHLPGSGNDGQIVVLAHHPHTQWHTHLTVIASGRPTHVKVRCKQLIKPLLYCGFSVRTRNGDNGNVELAAMVGCEHLQCLQWGFDNKEIGFQAYNGLLHHKIPHSSPVEFFHILVPVVLLCFQSKKERFLRETQASAVNQQPVNLRLGRSLPLCANHLRNFINAIHLRPYFYF